MLTEFNSGMTPQRTEQVEERLKIDVLAELEDSAHPHAPSPPAEGMDPEAAGAAAAALHAHQHAPGVKKIVVHEVSDAGMRIDVAARTGGWKKLLTADLSRTPVAFSIRVKWPLICCPLCVL